jgi:hypothetical protein
MRRYWFRTTPDGDPRWYYREDDVRDLQNKLTEYKGAMSRCIALEDENRRLKDKLQRSEADADQWYQRSQELMDTLSDRANDFREHPPVPGGYRGETHSDYIKQMIQRELEQEDL